MGIVKKAVGLTKKNWMSWALGAIVGAIALAAFQLFSGWKI